MKLNERRKKKGEPERRKNSNRMCLWIVFKAIPAL